MTGCVPGHSGLKKRWRKKRALTKVILPEVFIPTKNIRDARTVEQKNVLSAETVAR